MKTGIAGDTTLLLANTDVDLSLKLPCGLSPATYELDLYVVV
jgi:hypothetical protein